MAVFQSAVPVDFVHLRADVCPALAVVVVRLQNQPLAIATE